MTFTRNNRKFIKLYLFAIFSGSHNIMSNNIQLHNKFKDIQILLLCCLPKEDFFLYSHILP